MFITAEITKPLSTINNIKNTFQTNDIAANIINQVENLKNQNKNVKFILTPGHCEINENELTDQVNQHGKYASVSEASKRKYSTILDPKIHIKTITRNRYIAKSLVKPKKINYEKLNKT